MPVIQPFSDWIITDVFPRRHRLGFALLIGAPVGLAIHLFTKAANKAGTWAEFLSAVDPRQIPQVRFEMSAMAFGQALACAAFVAMTPAPSESPWKMAHTAVASAVLDRACARVKGLVMFLFTSWMVYYIGTAILTASKSSPLNLPVYVTMTAVTSVSLFWLYLELATLTVLDGASTSLESVAHHRWLSAAIGVAIVVAVWITYGVALTDRTDAPIIAMKVLDGIGECFGGVGLALVVGRLGSPLINPGPVSLGVLYFYAVIQPLGVLFPDQPTVQLALITLALVFKAWLWLVCVWAFTSGKLWEYVREVRALLVELETRKPEET